MKVGCLLAGFDVLSQAKALPSSGYCKAEGGWAFPLPSKQRGTKSRITLLPLGSKWSWAPTSIPGDYSKEEFVKWAHLSLRYGLCSMRTVTRPELLKFSGTETLTPEFRWASKAVLRSVATYSLHVCRERREISGNHTILGWWKCLSSVGNQLPDTSKCSQICESAHLIVYLLLRNCCSETAGKYIDWILTGKETGYIYIVCVGGNLIYFT